MPLGMEIGLGPGDFVLDGNRTPLPQKGCGAPPPKKNSAHVYCDKTAGWIKLVLGTEIGLNPGDFVLNGDPARPQIFAHVYYSYCDFVRALHRRKALLAYTKKTFPKIKKR